MLVDTWYGIGKQQERALENAGWSNEDTKALSTWLLSKDSSPLPEADLPISQKSVTGKSMLREACLSLELTGR